jgi:PKD repeat protein
MSFKYTYLIVVLIFFNMSASIGQVKRKKVTPVVCPAGIHLSTHRVPPPAKFLNRNANSRFATNRTTPNADIVVTYNGFTVEAQIAFQHAVDIWSSLLYSDVPIYIQANFTELDEGVLGSAGTGELIANFEGAPRTNTFYPIALAEKLAGQELNGPGLADINCNFSSVFDWYLGTDGEPGIKYDFVSVVLHELGHGLGFAAQGRSASSWHNGSEWPGQYFPFILNGEGTRIMDLEPGSDEIINFIISNNVYLDNPASVKANADTLPKIYAPDPYAGGSSLSHWDDATFDNTATALMTHAFAPGESVHDPGATTLGLFQDLGWFSSGYYHQPVTFVDNSRPVVIKTEIFSDSTIISKDLVLTYSIDGGITNIPVNMTESSANNFEAVIDVPLLATSFQYAISGLEDAYGNKFTRPIDGNYTAKVGTAAAAVNADYTLAQGGDFESNMGDFIAHSTSGSTFTLGNSVMQNKSGTNSGDNAWVLGIDQLNYDSLTEAFLYTPIFDMTLAGDYTMEFYAKYATEDEWDGFVVEYSIGNTSEWQYLEGNDTDVWYDSPTTFNGGAFTFQENLPFFSGTTNNEFVKKSLTFNELSGNDEVQFRFHFKADGLEQDAGIAIDDFQLTFPTEQSIVVAYSSDKDLICVDDEIMIENSSTGAIASYSWDFGDGAIPATASGYTPPSITYTTSGVKTISLTTTDGSGTAQEINATITVLSYPMDLAVSDIAEVYCTGDAPVIEVASAETGVTYTLQRFTTSFNNIGDPILGDGSNISFSLDELPTGSYRYFILAENEAGCTIRFTEDTRFVIKQSPFVEIIQEGNNILKVNATNYDSYQWFIDGAEANEFTTSFISTSQSGIYTIVVTDEECSYTSEAYDFILLSNSQLVSQFGLYPNPSSTMVSINFKTKGDYELRILDVSGRLIQKNNVKNSEMSTLAVESLKTGIYYLQISNFEHTETMKFVKK